MINCVCVADHDDMNGGLREDCLIHGKPLRPSWDDWALAIAEAVSQRADCTRSKVGAVILSRSHRVLSVGYNGVIAGVPGCLTAGNCPRGQHGPTEGLRLTGDYGHVRCLCGSTWPCDKAVEQDSDYANCIATHAERNAIEHAPPDQLRDSTLYVTRKPCPACTTLIQACGIKRVVTPEDRRRCIGCGEYEGDDDNHCPARQSAWEPHVFVPEE